MKWQLPWDEYRMTAGAIQVIQNAQEEIERLGTIAIGPEHLLIGLARADGSIAAEILKRHGIFRERILLEIDREESAGEATMVSTVVNLRPDARKALEDAAREARISLSEVLWLDGEITTEHLLLGLTHDARSSEGAVPLLGQMGVDIGQLRRDVLEYIGIPPPPLSGDEGEARIFQPVDSYQELVVYRLAVEASLRLYELSKTFPPEEHLVPELRHAARDVCTLIAGAWEKRKERASDRLLDIKGRIIEMQVLLDLAAGYLYLPADSAEALKNVYERIHETLPEIMA